MADDDAVALSRRAKAAQRLPDVLAVGLATAAHGCA